MTAGAQHSPEPHRRRIAVIGAGIGGLTVAWRLQQAGFEVEVFERESQVGGRVKSVGLGNSTIDTGATVFLPAYREALALIREFGMDGELEPIRGQMVFPVNGRMHLLDMDRPIRSFLSTPILGWRSKLSLVRLLFKFLTVRKSLNFLSLGDAQGHDLETLASYCRETLPPEVYNRLLNPALKFLYIHNGESGSLIELLWWMHASGLGKPRSLRRGTGSLTDALAQRLLVHTDSTVTCVAQCAAEVRIDITGKDGACRVHCADACVVTIPGTLAAQICRDGLSARQRAFLDGRRYDRCVVVSFCTRRRPSLDALMFMVPDDFNADLATVIFAHNIGPARAPEGQGIVNAYFMKSWSDRYCDATDEQILQAAQAQLGTWVPEVRDLAAWHVRRWPHTAAITETGDCARIRAFEEDIDPLSPIQVIGDFQAQASINVAVANANRAAQQLIRRMAAGNDVSG